MTAQIQNEYFPDYVSPPGDTLQETLEAIGMSQAEFARRTGRPKKTINEIIQGKTAITPDTAIQFERVLDIPADFWMRREARYRETLARLQDEESLTAQLPRLAEIPVAEMVKSGWIEKSPDKIAQAKEVLRFYAVASFNQYETIWQDVAVAYRKSPNFQSSPGTLSAWLRRGEIQAQEINCQPYEEEKFRQALKEIRSLTVEEPEVFRPEVVKRCAETGVAVVFVPELPRTGVSGATRWLSPSKALLQLSLRYKTDDHLWFSFFHEAGHILLHGKRNIFLENGTPDDGKEIQADNFAAATLIPPEKWQTFVGTGDFHSKAGIQAFASEVGIAPGIVVGRLQHDEYLPYSHCNDLKQRFEWVQDQETNE